MPSPKPFHRYDPRLVALLERALDIGHVRVRFKHAREASNMRQRLYQLRRAMLEAKPRRYARVKDLQFTVLGQSLLITLTAKPDVLDPIEEALRG